MSEAVIRIPTPLRAYTGGASEVPVRGATVGQALSALGERHAGLLERVLDPAGRLRGFVNVYVGEQNVRSIDGLDTPLAGGEVISIVPAVAGGLPPDTAPGALPPTPRALPTRRAADRASLRSGRVPAQGPAPRGRGLPTDTAPGALPPNPRALPARRAADRASLRSGCFPPQGPAPRGGGLR